MYNLPECLTNVEKLRAYKDFLQETDYIACKIAEGSATKDEYADIITKRQQWREEINRLEGEVQV